MPARAFSFARGAGRTVGSCASGEPGGQNRKGDIMSTSRDSDSSHPLEQVTGEKDVHPEEEEQRADGADPGAADTSAEREQR